jgi:hypothetical protein
MISMMLPDVHPDDIYNQADVVRRLSEWVFSSTFNHVPSPTQEVVTFALPSAPSSPTSPREIHRPPPLDLKGQDNFLSPQAAHSILYTSGSKEKKPKRILTLGAVNNLFCLSGPARSGKTQLAAHMCEWLTQLKCLGGYFSFDGGFDRFPPRLTLDSLPMTLMHQMATTERDTIGSFSKALTTESGALNYPLEKRFEKLFVEPLREFVAGRVNAKWNPLDPLVFIVDGVGVGNDSPTRGGGEVDSEDEDAAMARMMVAWLCSSGFAKLPRFVKFLVFMRSESEVERLLRERGVNVFEMGPAAVGSPMEVSNGGLGMNGGRWPVISSAVKSSSRTLLANQL